MNDGVLYVIADNWSCSLAMAFVARLASMAMLA